MSNDPEFRNILVGLEYFVTDLSNASVILAWNFSCMCIALYKNQLQFVKKLSSFFSRLFFEKGKDEKSSLAEITLFWIAVEWRWLYLQSL